MARSIQQEYDDNDAAIQAITNGAQSYNANGFSLTRADLPTLYERQKYLGPMLGRASRASTQVLKS